MARSIPRNKKILLPEVNLQEEEFFCEPQAAVDGWGLIETRPKLVIANIELSVQ